MALLQAQQEGTDNNCPDASSSSAASDNKGELRQNQPVNLDPYANALAGESAAEAASEGANDDFEDVEDCEGPAMSTNLKVADDAGSAHVADAGPEWVIAVEDHGTYAQAPEVKFPRLTWSVRQGSWATSCRLHGLLLCPVQWRSWLFVRPVRRRCCEIGHYLIRVNESFLTEMLVTCACLTQLTDLGQYGNGHAQFICIWEA